ncbi:MAG: DUF4440 domain-containing protein [Rhodospirillaceae bacterium]|nr:DUF4440 domain-containing protein [Rhodospirillaceae bacterium]
MSEEVAVLFANEAFYNAFATRDLEALDEIWSREMPAVCVHPGWGPLYGRNAVMQSWAGILSAPSAPSISCHDAKAHFLSDDICYVTCYELIAEDALVATNVYVKEATGWRMIHHHASPAAVPPSELEEGTQRLQ